MEAYRDASKTPEERAKDLMSRMSLREKVGQINQRLLGFSAYERDGDEITLTEEFKNEVNKYGGLGVLYGLYRADPWSKRDFSNGLCGAYMKKAYNLAQKYVMEHSRFGLPMLTSTECPHGHQALDGYLLPVNLAMGATFDPQLVKKAFNVCGKQVKELGADFALISMLDVLRDPRWGRSEECYSEDPYLAARLAENAVEGCQSAGVPVVSKHFCAQGETTGGVNSSAARIGQRELREIHLPPMKACCEAGVKGVMAAYNEIDGMYCHGNRELLQDVLRGEMGFKGLVMADGVAIDRLDALTNDNTASGAMALEAGVDVSLWDNGFSHLEEAVERGLVLEKEVDRACLRVLTMKFEQGLFEHPFIEETEPERFDYEKYGESLQIARESAVLLKRDILPLKNKNIRIAVIGPNADNIYNQLGDYTPAQRDGTGYTLLRGISEEFGEENVIFSQGCTVCGADRRGFEHAVETAKESDVVILALGGSSSRFAGASFDNNGAAMTDGEVQMDCGEGVDSATLRLPGIQSELAKAIFETGKPVITVIIAGRPYIINDIAEKSGDLIYAFYPGPMGGRALAEIISGRISPSGRLPASLPYSVGQLPCYYNKKASSPPSRFPDEPHTSPYTFGFGSSYSHFEISDVQYPQPLSKDELKSGRRFEISFKIRNTGDVSADAVPMLFIRRERSSTVQRVKELKAFTRVSLGPGEEKTCSLILGEKELSMWDARRQFTLEDGGVTLFLEEGGVLCSKGQITIKK